MTCKMNGFALGISLHIFFHVKPSSFSLSEPYEVRKLVIERK